MRNFKRLLESRTGFVPRTQAQALRGFSEGLLNPEYYMYKAVNVHPILEEPWDLPEMDRLLAKPDLDLETASLLMAVFEKMIKHKDKELALFAAESINALERRHLSRLQALKEGLADDDGPGTARAVVEGYRAMARLFAERPVLRGFYLSEARRYAEAYSGRLADPELDLPARIDILVDMGEPRLAAEVLDRGLAEHPGSLKLRFLSAKLAFITRRYRDVAEELEAMGDGAGPAELALRNFWIGGQDGG